VIVGVAVGEAVATTGVAAAGGDPACAFVVESSLPQEKTAIERVIKNGKTGQRTLLGCDVICL
jgi:hypothetical protein